MGMASEQNGRTYRERDVDKTLDDHERRLSRLEIGAIFAAGYVVADAPDVVAALLQFVP